MDTMTSEYENLAIETYHTTLLSKSKLFRNAENTVFGINPYKWMIFY